MSCLVEMKCNIIHSSFENVKIYKHSKVKEKYIKDMTETM